MVFKADTDYLACNFSLKFDLQSVASPRQAASWRAQKSNCAGQLGFVTVDA